MAGEVVKINKFIHNLDHKFLLVVVDLVVWTPIMISIHVDTLSLTSLLMLVCSTMFVPSIGFYPCLNLEAVDMTIHRLTRPVPPPPASH